jgi:S-adenosylmethionine:tRNA ribosyltransferase-isomerase
VKTSDFDYELPPEYIAQTPVEPRDASRLLILDRQKDELEQTQFRNIGHYLQPGDLLVLNETRVIPARMYAHKVPSGGLVEILLLRRRDDLTWEALVGGKRPRAGTRLEIEQCLYAEIVAELDGSNRLVRFESPIEPVLEKVGHTPLPPYIHTRLENSERYQTVYARQPGSAAAPTAGLHFTPQLIASLQNLGVRFASVTLHVGLDTFAPVNEDDPRTHLIHSEWCQLGEQAAYAINTTRAQGGRVIAVGTTSVRTLESAARHTRDGQPVGAFEGQTDLFILPGFSFQVVDAMITNFHLPRSTLIMLVSAFAGSQRILAAYEEAKRLRFRFYSFGDAMLIT